MILKWATAQKSALLACQQIAWPVAFLDYICVKERDQESLKNKVNVSFKLAHSDLQELFPSQGYVH